MIDLKKALQRDRGMIVYDERLLKDIAVIIIEKNLICKYFLLDVFELKVDIQEAFKSLQGRYMIPYEQEQMKKAIASLLKDKPYKVEVIYV